MAQAFNERSGTASGKQVAVDFIARMCWLPDFVPGTGPTQAIITRSIGSSRTGIPRFGLPET